MSTIQLLAFVVLPIVVAGLGWILTRTPID
jgi:hypothetical protein